MHDNDESYISQVRMNILAFFQTMWNARKYWRFKTNKEHDNRWASSNVLTYHFSSS